MKVGLSTKKSTGLSDSVVGPILYGAVFVAVLPAMLWLWAKRMQPVFGGWPIPIASGWGALVASAGLILMLSGMHALWKWGGGLPMNAYPPARFVTASVYRWLLHPIYVGFVLLCFGASAWLDLAAGFWFVSPLVAASCAALVWGYEQHDLARRFPDAHRAYWLRLPSNDAATPDFRERWASAILAFAPWAIAYLLFAAMPAPVDIREIRFAWEFDLPRPGWSVWPYTFAYGWVALAPFIVSSRRVLRDFVLDGWILGAVGYLLMLGLPFAAAALPVTGTALAQALWSANHAWDAPWLAIPSFHVAWSIVACAAYVERWPRVRWASWVIVAVIAISCILVGLHGGLDVIAGVVLGGLTRYKQFVWAGLLRLIERLGNSWRAWRFRSFRIINHAVYSGLAGAIGSGLAVYLAGPASAVYVLSCAIAGLVGAGLWGQWVEGSSHLLRPFGYYGCLFGSMLALGGMSWVNPEQGAIIAAAIATGATFTQAVGRLRCVIQGCCHGRLAPAAYGIRIRHPRSRVCALANLCGEPIYPTPLYSILANCAIGLLLLRLWSVKAPSTLIAGLYLILSALTRFVEESYRGEPQTLVLRRLALYQWLAIGCLIGGVVVTALPGPAAHIAGTLGPAIWETALITSMVAAFLMSMDFPHSGRRFARLTIE